MRMITVTAITTGTLTSRSQTKLPWPRWPGELCLLGPPTRRASRYGHGMDRVWQWIWNRHAARYSWAVYILAITVSLPNYIVWSSLIVAVEGSTAFVEAAAVAVVAVPLLAYANILPGIGWARRVDRWAAGREVDPESALGATYAWTRGAVVRIVGCNGICVALLSVVVGAVAGVSGSRLRPIRDPGRGGGSNHRAEQHALSRRSNDPASQDRYRR